MIGDILQRVVIFHIICFSLAKKQNASLHACQLHF